MKGGEKERLMVLDNSRYIGKKKGNILRADHEPEAAHRLVLKAKIEVWKTLDIQKGTLVKPYNDSLEDQRP